MRRFAAIALGLALSVQPDPPARSAPGDERPNEDGTPALTDPALESIADARERLGPGEAVLDVTVLNESVAIPLTQLAHHRAVNLAVAGRRVAAVCTPETATLALLSRTLGPKGDGEGVTIQLADSGLRRDHDAPLLELGTGSLWSPLRTAFERGQLRGAEPERLPVRVVTLERFASTHPGGLVVAPTDEARIEPDPARGPIGLGVFHGERRWFVEAETLGEGYTLHTPSGPVIARRTRGDGWSGVEVIGVAPGAGTVQTTRGAWT
ncbi:MAG: DUF3179 domain-containing (seleno)protein, partial [Phycisphaerales bacterium JB040]